jgi:agmatine deiminase
MKKILVLVLVVAAIIANAQNPLPRFATAEEKALPYTPPPIPENVISTPPPFTPRNMAEWEEVEWLVITWTGFPDILKEIVRHGRLEAKVLISCSDSNQVKTYLTNNQVPLGNVYYLHTPFNSIWIRDYFANSIYQNEVDSLYLVDWIYNRPRPADDLLPINVANHLNIQTFSTTTVPTDLVHTGGNFMSDGSGLGFSSELVDEENGPNGNHNLTNKTPAQVDSIMKWYHGIEYYVKMTALPYDIINHIDMHMKLLNEQTLLVGEFPVGVSDGPQIESNISYIQNNFTDQWGEPLRIVRIPMVPSTSGAYPPSGHYRTFSNSIFINKTVLVPLYYQAFDTIALRLYKEYLPGYNIVGINCQAIIPSAGALHCITHTIGVKDPLLIKHQNKLSHSLDNNATVNIAAYANHRSGISNATLYYTLDTAAGYQSVAMTLVNPQDKIWQGQIPNNFFPQANQSEFYYYIQATSNSGKQQLRPIVAPDGFYTSVATRSSIGVEESLVLTTELFPNPANEILQISVSYPGEAESSIWITDMNGQVVRVVHSGRESKGSNSYFVYTADLASGVYFVKLQHGTQQYVEKLIIQH